MMISRYVFVGALSAALAFGSTGCGVDESKKKAKSSAGSTSAGVTTGTGGGTISGTSGDDVLTGTPLADTISGLDGNDTISGLADNDILNGDAGDDTINGDDGDDTIAGGLGNDIIDGGNGDDTIDGGAGDDQILGGEGSDTITGGDSGDDTIDGGFGDDTIAGGPGADTLDGGGDADTLDYSTSPAAVTVDLGLNAVSGGDAAGDTVSNFENVRGTVDLDTLTGADGANNVFEGGAGADTISGGPNSSNTVSYEHAPSTVTIDLNVGMQAGTSDEQGDLLIDIQNVRGSAFDDVIVGIDGGGIGTIEGGPGADTLTVSPNLGGNVSYEHSAAGVSVDLDTNAVAGGDAVGDDITNPDIDGIVGSAFNDVLVGSELWGTRLFGLDGDDTLTASNAAIQFGNVLVGGEGNDILNGGDQSPNTLDGGEGDDVITGGLNGDNTVDGGGGADTIIGGNGNDQIVYDPADVSYDFMTTVGVDVLIVELDIDFSAPGPQISNMQDLAVPGVGGAQINVTITPADLTASTQANLMMIDANPYTANSDAVIQGTGWTRNGTTNMFGIDYLRWEGAGGAVLLVNPLVTNVAGIR
jgi:Ca2+-binding RTX toxin-like protein